MYGAILGDIIGSPYEFDRGRKTEYGGGVEHLGRCELNTLVAVN